uniref:extracellular calcium-sensing receptor-like isoform X2 n=1 Tax=Myxine glutinosa TaxID=7769 RepID=UPI00358E5E1B
MDVIVRIYIVNTFIQLILELFYGVTTYDTSKEIAPISFNARRLRWAVSVVFALDEINQHPTLLPNMTLGYVIFNSCFGMSRVEDAMLRFLGPPVANEVNDAVDEKCPISAVLGSSGSTLSSAMNELLALQSVPQVSYLSSCECLSDKHRFPTFFRTIPSDAYQSVALADIVKHFGWLYIGATAVDDDYGRGGISRFVLEAEGRGACIAFRNMLPAIQQPRAFEALATLIAETKAKVILLYLSEPDMVKLAEELRKQNVTEMFWIANTAWVTSPLISSTHYRHIFGSVVGLALPRATISGLRDFLLKIKPGNTKWSDRRSPVKMGNLNRNILNPQNCRYFCHNHSIEQRSNQTYLNHFIKSHNWHGRYLDQPGCKMNTTYPNNFKPAIQQCICTCTNYSIKSNFYLIPEHNNSMGITENDPPMELPENIARPLIKNFAGYPPDKFHIPQRRDQKDVIRELWEVTFNCSWVTDGTRTQCTGEEDLQDVYSPFTDVAQLRVTYSTYMAIYAVVHALHDLQACRPMHGPFSNASCATIKSLQPWHVLYYLRKVNFQSILGEAMSFDQNGDPPAVFQLINWQRNEEDDVNGVVHFKKVGGYNSGASPGHVLQVDADHIVWAGGKRKAEESICSKPCTTGTRLVAIKGRPFCCFDCIPCTGGEFANDTNSQECYKCPRKFWSNDLRDSCVPMPEEFLSFSDPLAIALLVLAALGMVLTLTVTLVLFRARPPHLLLLALAACFASCVPFVGRPTQLSCQLREPLACICLTVAIASELFLVMEVLQVKSGEGHPADMEMGQSKHVIHILSGTAGIIQVVLCLFWILKGSSSVVENTRIRPGAIIVTCTGTSPAWPISALIYLGILTGICYILTLKARKLTMAFNLPKFINFSMTICFMVALAFLPAYSSTQGSFQDVTEMFAVLATAYTLLGCLFVPKCYVVIFKVH